MLFRKGGQEEQPQGSMGSQRARKVSQMGGQFDPFTFGKRCPLSTRDLLCLSPSAVLRTLLGDWDGF